MSNLILDDNDVTLRVWAVEQAILAISRETIHPDVGVIPAAKSIFDWVKTGAGRVE